MIPHRPHIEGADNFGGPIIHSAECGTKSGPIVKDSNIETVAVLGSGKSAWDGVYLAAMAGKKVEWIIRKSGRGSAYVFPPHAHIGPFKARREVSLVHGNVVFTDMRSFSLFAASSLASPLASGRMA